MFQIVSESQLLFSTVYLNSPLSLRGTPLVLALSVLHGVMSIKTGANAKCVRFSEVSV